MELQKIFEELFIDFKINLEKKKRRYYERGNENWKNFLKQSSNQITKTALLVSVEAKLVRIFLRKMIFLVFTISLLDLKWIKRLTIFCLTSHQIQTKVYQESSICEH